MSFERIGRRIEGKTSKWPTQYVDEQDFDRGQDPAPNRVELNKEFFCLLAPGTTFLPFVTRESLMKEIEEYKKSLEASNEKPIEKSSVPLVDPDEPPPPEGNDETPVPTVRPTRRNHQ